MSSIKKYRKMAGLTQQELAQKVGVALDTISRYETSKREPRLSDLRKMAEILGCTVDDLVADAQEEAETA